MITVIGSMFRVDSGGTPGVISNDSETFRLDNLEPEIVGGSCGVPDRGGVSKNGSNK